MSFPPFGRSGREVALETQSQGGHEEKDCLGGILLIGNTGFATCHPVNCPTRWSLSLVFGFLWWSSSWRWRPHIGGCRLLWPPLRAGIAVLTQFFCKKYFLYVWRELTKNLAAFLGFLPPKKAQSSKHQPPIRRFSKIEGRPSILEKCTSKLFVIRMIFYNQLF